MEQENYLKSERLTQDDLMKAEVCGMKKRICKICMAVIGLAVMIGLTARTVSGKEQKPETLTADVYESMETEYLSEVKAVLTQNHYRNSGVNMTKVIDGEENRTYTIEIYHNRLHQGDVYAEQELLEQLQTLKGFGDGCTIEYVIAREL